MPVSHFKPNIQLHEKIWTLKNHATMKRIFYLLVLQLLIIMLNNSQLCNLNSIFQRATLLLVHIDSVSIWLKGQSHSNGDRPTINEIGHCCSLHSHWY